MTASTPFSQYRSEIKGIGLRYRRQARHNEWLANSISIALIAAGSAVGLTGLAGEYTGWLSAALGFTVVLLEGASRVFKPACRAAVARRAVHALDREFRLWAVSGAEYDGDMDEARLLFVDKIERILQQAYTDQEAGAQDPALTQRPAPSPAFTAPAGKTLRRPLPAA